MVPTPSDASIEKKISKSCLYFVEHIRIAMQEWIHRWKDVFLLSPIEFWQLHSQQNKLNSELKEEIFNPKNPLIEHHHFAVILCIIIFFNAKKLL